MNKLKIQLPKVAEWSPAENYAENLRMNTAGCVPVGLPRIVADNAGEQTVMLDGRLLTVADDGRTLTIDGETAGALNGRFLAALPDGERVIIFTDTGVEWLSGTSAEGTAPTAMNVSIGISASKETLTAEVIPPSKLSGTYTRSSEALQQADCTAMAAPAYAALRQLSAAAFARGLLTQPAWVSWRMVDVDGRTVAVGSPQRFGSLQGGNTLKFAATKEGNTVSLNGTATMSVEAYGLNISIGRADSAFWRRRVRTLEIILWRDCMSVKSTTGYISMPELTVTPRPEELERSGTGIIAARISMPLEGVSATLPLSDLGAAVAANDVDLKVSALHCAGTLNAYALNDKPGILAIAPGDDPLRVAVTARICRGEILRICSPSGSGGGWNYGRHHLLAFSTEGVYAVSVDGALTTIAATPICGEGISRSDAISVAPDAIFMATASGFLLRLKGARVERMPLPVSVSALCWNSTYGELWLRSNDDRIFVLGSDGSLGVRSVISIERFVEPAMAVDLRGVLHSLAVEDAVAVMIKWQRRVNDTGNDLERSARWLLDAENSIALTLALMADNGGTPQRIITHEINGPINAPFTAWFRAPVRIGFTASIHGIVKPPAHFRSVDVGAAKQYPQGVLFQRGRRGGL